MSFKKRAPASFPLAVAVLMAGLSLAPAKGSAPRLPPAYGASGSYLAAIVANSQRDTGSAAEYYREALKADPRNATLLDQTFVAELLDGNLPEAFRYAEKTIARDPGNTLAQAVLGVRAMRAREYAKARNHFDRAAGGVRGADLALTLFKAYALAGQGEAQTALKSIDRFSDTESKALRDYFSGLLADVFALYIKTKNFHWHVSGPHFRDYHLMLDEQSAEILAMTDPMAERARKIGGTTLRSIGQIAKESRIADNDADFYTKFN